MFKCQVNSIHQQKSWGGRTVRDDHEADILGFATEWPLRVVCLRRGFYPKTGGHPRLRGDMLLGNPALCIDPNGGCSEEFGKIDATTISERNGA
jgi:hypothetical protein